MNLGIFIFLGLVRSLVEILPLSILGGGLVMDYVSGGTLSEYIGLYRMLDIGIFCALFAVSCRHIPKAFKKEYRGAVENLILMMVAPLAMLLCVRSNILLLMVESSLWLAIVSFLAVAGLLYFKVRTKTHKTPFESLQFLAIGMMSAVLMLLGVPCLASSFVLLRWSGNGAKKSLSFSVAFSAIVRLLIFARCMFGRELRSFAIQNTKAVIVSNVIVFAISLVLLLLARKVYLSERRLKAFSACNLILFLAVMSVLLVK